MMKLLSSCDYNEVAQGDIHIVKSFNGEDVATFCGRKFPLDEIGTTWIYVLGKPTCHRCKGEKECIDRQFAREQLDKLKKLVGE